MKLALAAIAAALLLTAAPASAAGKMCGGFIGATCAKSQWCDFGAHGQCGAADQSGVCRRRPQLCTMEYGPVCGCDGKTYSNACVAHGNGVSVSHEGACRGGSIFRSLRGKRG